MIVAALSLLLAAQGSAETPPAAWTRGEWIELQRDAEMVISLDESRTRRDGDRVRLRLRALLAPEHYQGARYGLTEMELDCRRRTVKGIALSEYDAAGQTLRDQGAEETRGEQPWPEGAPAAETFAAVCHRTGWGEEGAAE